MRKIVAAALTAFSSLVPMVQPVSAQEIIVTAQRREADDFNPSQPAIGLRRPADFAIQEVTITGDTRDEAKRHDEMFGMVRQAVTLAERNGVALATGDTVIEPLTLANFRNLTLRKDSRPDSEKVSFLVKAPLGDGIDAKSALDRIDRFVKAVPPVGRALIQRSDDLSLSVVDPDQYRGQIIDLVAADSRAVATRFGADYAVEAKGIERPVEWSRAGLSDVLLYIPYQATIVPKR